MPSTAEYTIRQATEEDVPLILTLIHALAAYEREPASTILATEASLRATLSFPSNPSTGYAKTLLIFPLDTEKADGNASGGDGNADAESADKGDASGGAESGAESECAGFALYFHNYSTWRGCLGVYLEDLFVRPAYRGRGFGTALLRELARVCLDVSEGKGRVEWSVLKWNTPSIEFYQSGKVGARRMEEWVGMRVEGEGVKRLAGLDVEETKEGGLSEG